MSDKSGEFPAGPEIPLVYQLEMAQDQNRTAALKDAVESVVDDGDVVADLGAGIGILSHLAAKKAQKVYAVEFLPDVFKRGKKITQENGVDNVHWLNKDAREITLDEKVDVVLCEMLDTGLIDELQVPVMNHATENILKPEGAVIPAKAKTTVQLVRANYDVLGTTFKAPHFEEFGGKQSIPLSSEIEYHTASFKDHTPVTVETDVDVPASTAGIVNGVQLNTYIQFAEGMAYTGPSRWLDPPLNLPVEDTPVEQGEELTVRLSYELGGGYNRIDAGIGKQA